MTAYHDNSAANKENPDPTAFVGWGPRTVDEMANAWIDFYYLDEQEYLAVSRRRARRRSGELTIGVERDGSTMRRR